MGSKWSIDNNDDHSVILINAWARLDLDGTGHSERRAQAERIRRQLAKHAAIDRRRGNPCEADGEPWPCDYVRSIFAAN